jgi:hypothetical protein
MLKFFAFTLGLMAIGFIVQLQFPWWSIAVVAALAGAWTRFGAGRNFLMGFLAVFLLWTAYAWWIDLANEGILSGRIAQLFSISASLLPFVSGLIGGLVGGLAAMSAGLASKLLG